MQFGLEIHASRMYCYIFGRTVAINKWKCSVTIESYVYFCTIYWRSFFMLANSGLFFTVSNFNMYPLSICSREYISTGQIGSNCGSVNTLCLSITNIEHQSDWAVNNWCIIDQHQNNALFLRFFFVSVCLR